MSFTNVFLIIFPSLLSNACSLNSITDDEASLAKIIEQFQLNGFPLTIKRVCQLAFQYANVNNLTGFSDSKQAAGQKWLKGFFGQTPHNNIKEGKKPINSTCNGCKPNSNRSMV